MTYNYRHELAMIMYREGMLFSDDMSDADLVATVLGQRYAVGKLDGYDEGYKRACDDISKLVTKEEEKFNANRA